MRKSLLLLCIIAVAAPVQSQVAHDATGRSYAKIFGSELEKMTLHDVFTKLGSARCYESGDAAEYEKRAHYYLKKDSSFLTFTSGELDGGNRISALKLSTVKPKEGFTVNTEVKLIQEDLGGIRLGMSQEQLLNSIPASAIFNKTNPEYDSIIFLGKKPDTLIRFENVIPMTGQEINQPKYKDLRYQAWHEFISIIPVFRDGKLAEIVIGKTTGD